MASNNNNNHGQHPFWDFVQSFDPNGQQRAGAGVDHAATGPASGAPFGFPLGGPGGFNPWTGGHGGWEGPWGPPGGFGRRGGPHGRHGGRHGRRHHRPGTPGSDEDSGDSEGHEVDMEASPDTLRNDDAPRGPPGPPPHPPHGDGHMPPPPPPPAMGDQPHPPPPHMGGHSHPPPPPHGGPRHHGRHGRHGHGGPGGPGPFGGRGGCRGRGGPRGRHGPPGPPPPFPSHNGPFDFSNLMQALSGHPAAQAFRGYFDRTQDGSAERSGEHEDSFVPPVDVFSTDKAYVLHVSLPGAIKEDVGVNWDAEKSQLNIAGVIYRPGDEQFLQCLTSSERKIGMFERSIRLPPADSDEKEEVDGFGITAKMENGILIVTVPKAEKEWTEIHKVDIQ